MSIDLVNGKAAIAKTVIVLVTIVVVAIIAGGVYFASTQNNPATPSATESPTPSTTPETTTSTTPTNTVNPSPSGAQNVAGASSLKYSVNLSADAPGLLRGTYTYYAKNVGTTSFMMRMEFTDLSSLQTIKIINGFQQKAWTYSNGEWTDISASYNDVYNVWNPLWQGYVNSLTSSWNGIGDYSYTVGSATVRIYDISVNPTLEDSLFQDS